MYFIAMLNSHNELLRLHVKRFILDADQSLSITIADYKAF